MCCVTVWSVKKHLHTTGEFCWILSGQECEASGSDCDDCKFLSDKCMFGRPGEHRNLEVFYIYGEGYPCVVLVGRETTAM